MCTPSRTALVCAHDRGSLTTLYLRAPGHTTQQSELCHSHRRPVRCPSGPQKSTHGEARNQPRNAEKKTNTFECVRYTTHADAFASDSTEPFQRMPLSTNPTLRQTIRKRKWIYSRPYPKRKEKALLAFRAISTGARKCDRDITSFIEMEPLHRCVTRRGESAASVNRKTCDRGPLSLS